MKGEDNFRPLVLYHCGYIVVNMLASAKESQLAACTPDTRDATMQQICTIRYVRFLQLRRRSQKQLACL